MGDPRPKQTDSSADPTVPKAVVSRLSLYLRELQHQVRDGKETTSSTQLGSLLGFTDAQVRKDLAYFGQFGYPGIGYRCDELIQAIKKILGTNRPWPLAMPLALTCPTSLGRSFAISSAPRIALAIDSPVILSR